MEARATTNQEISQLCVNTIRTLSMDAVQQANSGHPGTPMALAPVVYCLWQRFLRFDPDLAQSRPFRALGGPCCI
jgi:transketolase